MKPPIITIAANREDAAVWSSAEAHRLAAVVLNHFRAHGDPEAMCQALEPSLADALGAWLDEHFVSDEDVLPPLSAYEIEPETEHDAAAH
jgi:hypothetical protein